MTGHRWETNLRICNRNARVAREYRNALERFEEVICRCTARGSTHR